MGKLTYVLKSNKGGVMMDSKQKDVIKPVLKYIITIISTIIIVLILNKININKNNFNSIDGDEVAIAVLSENVTEDEELAELEKEEYIYTAISKIADSFNIEVNGFKIQVADSVFGYVSDEEERDEILQKVCSSYINELGIDGKNVVKVYVNNNLKAIPEKVNISKLENSSEIAEDLYDAVVINDNLLNLQLEVINNTTEVVEPSVVEEKSDELYMGETEVENGENGSKIVYSKEYYNGLSKVSENIINEVVIKEAKPSIIKKGTKNPYYDGVKFLSNPLENASITSVFGEARTGSYHKGVDLAKELGEEVNSAFEGEVIFAGYNNGGYGNLVIVQHDNDIQTYYAHLNEIKVDVGEYVSADSIIGTVGSTGYSTGPHLHFELRVGGNPVNPVSYIKDI